MKVFDILYSGMVILDIDKGLEEKKVRVVTWNGSLTIRFFMVVGEEWHEYDCLTMGEPGDFTAALEALARHGM